MVRKVGWWGCDSQMPPLGRILLSLEWSQPPRSCCIIVFSIGLPQPPLIRNPPKLSRDISNPVRIRQGTVGLELVQQVEDLSGRAHLDAVVVPVGGGGLISGVTTAVKALCPGIRVIGAEPQKAADAYRSKQVKHVSDKWRRNM